MSRIHLLADINQTLAMFGHPNQRLRTNHVRIQVSINQILHGSGDLLRIIGDNLRKSRIKRGVTSARACSRDDTVQSRSGRPESHPPPSGKRSMPPRRKPTHHGTHAIRISLPYSLHNSMGRRQSDHRPASGSVPDNHGPENELAIRRHPEASSVRWLPDTLAAALRVTGRNFSTPRPQDYELFWRQQKTLPTQTHRHQ